MGTEYRAVLLGKNPAVHPDPCNQYKDRANVDRNPIFPKFPHAPLTLVWHPRTIWTSMIAFLLPIAVLSTNRKDSKYNFLY
jgi:hypothetical protein